MDAILNDHSLNGQFSESEFTEYLRNDILPIMKTLEDNRIPLLKEDSTYTRSVISGKTLLQTLHTKGNPAIDRFKTLLFQLWYTEPFWNASSQTKPDLTYVCIIKETPNCITEAFERGGLLFSFRNSSFDTKCIPLSRSGISYDVRNFIDKNTLDSHLAELGLIVVWDPSKNSFIIPNLNYKFEIRFEEKHHNKPHFHLSNVDHSISLSIPDADVLAGSLPKQSIAISWGLKNMDNIVALWNEVHPENPVKL